MECSVSDYRCIVRSEHGYSSSAVSSGENDTVYVTYDLGETDDRCWEVTAVEAEVNTLAGEQNTVSLTNNRRIHNCEAPD